MKTLMQRWAWLVFWMMTLTAVAAAQAMAGAPAPVFNIMNFGAHNNGTGNASAAFKAAIAAAKKAGGGTVYVPAGHYISGPIRMVSNLTLYFAAGSVVRFPAVKLPLTWGRQQGVDTLTPVPLIGGDHLQNVAVEGRGVLMSSNAAWMKLHPRERRTATSIGSANGPAWEKLLHDINAGKKIPMAEYRAAGEELRPSFIRFMNSQNILVDGLRIEGSPMWTVHLLYSSNATVENMVIQTYPGVHTDGIVVDSSRFVRISNDYIDTGDDGIVLKAGKGLDGLRVDRPTEDVTITNCTVHHAHGAVTIGSETSGSIRNVVASNITAVDTVHGARIKSRRGRGGVVEDIRFDNWTMEHVDKGIVITNYYLMEGERRTTKEQPVSKRTPVFRNIAMSNMTIDGAKVLVDIEGLPEMPIRTLRLHDIIGSGDVGLKANYTNGLELDNMQLNSKLGPAFEVSHSTNLELDDVSSRRPAPGMPVIRLQETPGAIVRDSRAFPGTGVFLSTEPGALKHLFLVGNVLEDAATPTQQVERLDATHGQGQGR